MIFFKFEYREKVLKNALERIKWKRRNYLVSGFGSFSWMRYKEFPRMTLASSNNNIGCN